MNPFKIFNIIQTRSYPPVLLRLVFFFYLGLWSENVFSQQDSDTLYYVDFHDKITSRLYVSKKFTDFLINDRETNQTLRLQPNSNLNLGIGATYNNLTLNLALGFGFLNPERGRGETIFLDLQAHAYPKKLIIDVFLQFYRGYFLEKNNEANRIEHDIILFPDFRVRKVGLNVQYLFNGEKLSLRAAFLQNEWQQKSAGSFLAGVEIYNGAANAEGVILPSTILRDPLRNFNNFRYFDGGPNIGYVYTMVIKKHFFITGSASTSLGLGYSSLETALGRENQWGIRPNVFLRAFAGYNSERWSLNGNYVWNNVRMVGVEGFSNSMMTGNYRLNFIYRFSAGPKLKPFLEYLDLQRYL